jgi:hypothetical protein
MTLDELVQLSRAARTAHLMAYRDESGAIRKAERAAVVAIVEALRSETLGMMGKYAIMMMLDEILASDGEVKAAGGSSREDEQASEACGAPAAGFFDFEGHLAHQAMWSEATFGPGERLNGVSDHIRKELDEVGKAHRGVYRQAEWIDVVILALDGAWRSGMSPRQIINGIVAKQRKNEGRTWPDWRTADPNKAIEHDRAKEAAR